jgi:hypothetical protein
LDPFDESFVFQGREALGQIVCVQVVAGANESIACPLCRVSKNERLHVALTDEPATLARQGQTKAIAGIVNLIKDRCDDFCGKFWETGGSQAWKEINRVDVQKKKGLYWYLALATSLRSVENSTLSRRRLKKILLGSSWWNRNSPNFPQL